MLDQDEDPVETLHTLFAPSKLSIQRSSKCSEGKNGRVVDSVSSDLCAPFNRKVLARRDTFILCQVLRNFATAEVIVLSLLLPLLLTIAYSHYSDRKSLSIHHGYLT